MATKYETMTPEQQRNFEKNASVGTRFGNAQKVGSNKFTYQSSNSGYGYADTPEGSKKIFDPRGIKEGSVSVGKNPYQIDNGVARVGVNTPTPTATRISGGLADKSFTEQQLDPRVKAEMAKYPGLNVDAAIGNVIAQERKTGGVNYGTGGTAGTGAYEQDKGLTDQAINRPVLDFGTSGGVYDQMQQDRFGGVGAPSLTDIQEQERKKAQAMIDATEALYQDSLSKISQAGAEDLAQRSSELTSAGLAGSTFKSSAESRVRAATEEKMASERSRRSAEVANMMDVADQRAEQKFQTERDYYASERDAQLAYEKERQEESRAILAEYAAQGGNVDDFNVTQLNDIKARTGFDDFSLGVFMNANKPKAEQPDITYQTVGNKIIGYYTDFDENGNPTIKTIESPPLYEEEKLAANMEYNTQITDDGTILMIPKTFDPNLPIEDQIIQYGQQAQFAEKEAPLSEYDIAEKELALQKSMLEIDKLAKELEGETDPFELAKKQAELEKIYAETDKIRADIENKKSPISEPPTIKSINGVDSQWNTDTQEWEPLTVKNPQQVEQEINRSQNIIDIIDYLESAESATGRSVLSKNVGPISSRISTPLDMSGSTADWFTKLEQLKTLLTRENLSALKGLGAMSDRELQLIQNSSVALNPKGTEEQFRNELNKIKQTFEQSINKLGSNEISDSGSILQNLPPLTKNYENIEALTNDIPEYIPIVEDITRQALESGEDITRDDILKIITEDLQGMELNQQGFTSDLSMSQKGLGGLSEKFESGGDPGAIGYDSTGGYSYGAYQLAHQNAKRFIDQSEFKDDFIGIEFNSNDWQNKWKEIAQNEPEKFKSAQKDYIKKTHYDPQIKKLEEFGVNVNNLTPAMKDVIWSTAVQHGGNTDVIIKALERVGRGASEQDIIDAIYKERSTRFGSSTENVRNAVMNRFDQEKKLALSMIA